MKITNKNFKIRLAIAEDASAINHILYKTFISTYPCSNLNISRQDIENYVSTLLDPESIESRKQDILKGGYYIAELNDLENSDKICGFSRIKFNNNKHILRSLYILPENQNNGVGKALWEETKKEIKDNIYVYVADYNIKAIKFYESVGFSKTGQEIKEDRIKFGNVVINQIEMIYKI